MRYPCVVLGASVLMTGLWANGARADYPCIEVEPGLHRYQVWLDPTSEGSPLNATQQARYCGIAEEWARSIYRITNGAHAMYQVRFWYGSEPLEYDVHWGRFHDVANGNGRMLSGRINMFDQVELCHHEHVVDEAGQMSLQLMADPCPEGLTCAVGELGRELCVDA